MTSLKTKYMGLELDSPIIVGSSPLTANVANIKKAQDCGAGAVVLRSMFEELIDHQVESTISSAEDYMNYTDANSFLQSASRDHFVNEYLSLVKEAKKSVKIPLIASICCSEVGTWIEYAKRFEDCGADALELNYFILGSEASIDSARLEDKYLELISMARKSVKLPLSVKLSYQFTALASFIMKIEKFGVDSLVLFNHFARPDIDINKVQIDLNSIMKPRVSDYSETLRWIALMGAETKLELAASTGINDYETVIKMLLAGAKVCQLTTAIYQNGFDVISKMNSGLQTWMGEHNFKSIDDFRGILAQENVNDPTKWERSQYLKIKA